MLYRIDVQLTSSDQDPEEVWYTVLKKVLNPGYGEDIEYVDLASIRVKFDSVLLPSEVKKNLAMVMATYHGIHYVDVLYRFPAEIFHDRFVVWNDGTCQEYRSRTVYEEDGERTKI